MISRFFRRKDSPKARVPPGRRVYVIGDIHGRLDLLDGLFAKIEQDQRGRSVIRPEIVLLGDLIDRGAESAAVVRRAMNPPAWADVIALMGNHEDTMIEAINGDRDAMRRWLRFGGRESLLSWGVPLAAVEEGTTDQIISAAREAVPGEELAWIAQLRQSVRIGDYFLVHAGVRPGVPLDRQTPRDSYWIRDEFLQSPRNHGGIVVHGHSISLNIEERENRIGIDTGAYATDCLTALGLEGEERWTLQT